MELITASVIGRVLYELAKNQATLTLGTLQEKLADWTVDKLLFDRIQEQAQHLPRPEKSSAADYTQNIENSPTWQDLLKQIRPKSHTEQHHNQGITLSDSRIENVSGRITGGDHIPQTVAAGSTAVIHTGSGKLEIGYTITQHEQALREREQQVRQDLERAHRAEKKLERITLENELNAVQEQLQNLHNSYQDRIRLLEEAKQQLQALATGLSPEKLQAAKAALAQGDTTLADHLFAEVEALEQTGIERAAAAAYQRGKIAEDRIDYPKAYRHFQRAVQLAPAQLDYVAAAARLAYEMQDLHPAIRWMEQSLASRLKTDGDEHPSVANTRNNLGLAWHDLGELDKAIEYYEQALASKLNTYGDKHPSVAITRNNLGSAWQAQGEYAKAIDYFEQALASRLKTDGNDHPEVATTRNNLGLAWHDLGELDKAIEYYEQALASLLKTYGEEHPLVATTRHNLGAAWKDLGELDKAIEYYEQALASLLKTYGEKHPSVATTRNNLGLAWHDLGELDKAIEYYEQALASKLKTYGDEHPSVATIRNNLGLAWKDLGEHAKGIRYYEQALASDLKTYGDEHPSVARTRNNLGGAWYAQGEYDKAIRYYEQALATLDARLGAEHPHTKMVAENLAAARAAWNTGN